MIAVRIQHISVFINCVVKVIPFTVDLFPTGISSAVRAYITPEFLAAVLRNHFGCVLMPTHLFQLASDIVFAACDPLVCFHRAA